MLHSSPNQGPNTCPLQQKHGVLTARLPGNPQGILYSLTCWRVKWPQGYTLAGSRRLDLEGLVCAILRKMESGVLPTKSRIKVERVSWWKVGHVRSQQDSRSRAGDAKFSVLLRHRSEGKLPGDSEEGGVAVTCVAWWVGLYYVSWGRILGGRLRHEDIAFSNWLLLH